jgi:hypothetical protein
VESHTLQDEPIEISQRSKQDMKPKVKEEEKKREEVYEESEYIK